MTLSPARETQPSGTPEADWLHCPGCRGMLYRPRFRRELGVCPSCGHHARMGARDRIAFLLDAGSATEFGDLSGVPDDPLGFTDLRSYRDRLAEARARSGLTDAAACATGTLRGHPVVVAAMDFEFLGGSLGAALGALVEQAARAAVERGHPLLVVSASGGARMQEGAIALMQMARTSRALADLDAAGILTISLVTDPTYGGVAASFVPLADIVLAEPGARLGFAGPRVIAQTLGQELPEGFQTAEFLLEHGLVDAVVPRAAQRATLAALLSAARPSSPTRVEPVELVRDPGALPDRSAWDSVRAVRTAGRITTTSMIERVVDDFVELRGDRSGGDCPAIVTGLGRWDGVPVAIVGQQRGETVAERVHRNFGMPRPEGYRKAGRVMRLAEKLRIPVVTLVDTPGAHPGVDAERRGQAHAIADNLRLMARLAVPVVSVVLGEGGSGGALGVAVADRVYALEDSVFSVISPEGCAAILWRDAARAPEAAEALQIGAAALLRNGLVEGVIPGPSTDGALVGDAVRRTVTTALAELVGLPAEELRRTRALRYSAFGNHRDRGGNS
ncbi:Acetyl-coenzyme A carboxyl transferase beta chain [Pseudonocardia sp. Ae717_Ps2]|uniref:acetyl-CoA carboxylase, carboxyltransferase subunit beta n=1 Tax=Pseudonocardia sp. Ae717_Ps2 TaxID=1885573 RepID=UPI00094AA3FF|nr:acetyl-CoA carboxylase, carboxyltransferase subunit beta [Pseudonocardia sp. Ae717_Ps2]OLM27820.1 Acetyl-coenzyme A carboxyl transferase beta chain [Pseudonocardia sp. Ae717_Ps2]